MQLEYFQMIDAIAEIGDGTDFLVAHAKVPDQSPVFEGHFPDMPLVPGVLLIETMAQASGFLMLARTKFAAMPLLVGTKEVKLRGLVEPNAELEIRAELEHDGSGFAMTKASIKSDGKRICNASLTLKSIPYPDDTFATMIANRARDLGLNPSA